MGRWARAGRGGEAGPVGELRRLLAGSVLILLVLHLAGRLAAYLLQPPASGLRQAFGSADASALGLAAPLLLGAIAAATGRIGWRVRAPALLRAATAAAVLALADALSLPAWLGPGLAVGLDLRPCWGVPAPQLGILLAGAGAGAGAGVAAAAGLLLAPRPVADPAQAGVRRSLAGASLALAALHLAPGAAAGWSGVSDVWAVLADGVEEAGEGVVAAWVVATIVAHLSTVKQTVAL